MKRSYYVDQISPFIDKGLVKVFTGIRRCGKSYIMEMVRDMLIERGVAASQIVEANFESKTLDFVKSVELSVGYVKSRAETVGYTCSLMKYRNLTGGRNW